MSLLQDHNGDRRAAAARVPLHRAEPHREGADPLNGAPRPDLPRCVLAEHRRHLLRAPAIQGSGSDLLLQRNDETKQSLNGKRGSNWQNL